MKWNHRYLPYSTSSSNLDGGINIALDPLIRSFYFYKTTSINKINCVSLLLLHLLIGIKSINLPSIIPSTPSLPCPFPSTCLLAALPPSGLYKLALSPPVWDRTHGHRSNQSKINQSSVHFLPRCLAIPLLSFFISRQNTTPGCHNPNHPAPQSIK